jgi:putative two-component system response regulator
MEILLSELQQSGLYSDEVSAWDKNLVLQSVQLHDVGKIAVKDAVLLKPGKLNYEEFEQIKEHPLVGGKIIDEIIERTTHHEFLEYAKTFAVSHHEKWDGTGYPYKLKGEDIPLLGRVMAIADVYDALVFERLYKKAFSHEIAVEIIRTDSGTHFDPKLVELFLKCEKEFEKVVNV